LAIRASVRGSDVPSDQADDGPRTIGEVRRILLEHIAEFDA
jgi:hypothetical protein